MSAASSCLQYRECLRPHPSGLAARVLLGSMSRDEALKFLLEDCSFTTAPTLRLADEVWAASREIVQRNSPGTPARPRKLPLSETDLKAAAKVRRNHPGADFLVDFARLDPMDLVVHQLWISTEIADRYGQSVSPDKWLRTALLDPPSNEPSRFWREGDAIVFDLPHPEFFLAGPLRPNRSLEVREDDRFVTVAFHAGRALLMRGYHRTFACARFARESRNPPHGVLFGVSNRLSVMGSDADDIRRMMEGPQAPRVADFFDDRLFLPVALRRRRYRMKIRCEIEEIAAEDAEFDGDAIAPETAVPSHQAGPVTPKTAEACCVAAFELYSAGRIDESMALNRRALFLKPDCPDAHRNLGVALLERDETDQSREHFERAVALEPNNAEAHYNLAVVLAAQGRIDDACFRLTRSLALDPNHVKAHNELGNIFTAQGKFREALGQFDKATALNPSFAQAHYNRAGITVFRAEDSDIERLERLVGRPDLPADESIPLHFALAKALEDAGEYARAFEHLHRGNRAKRRGIRYDEDALTRLFENIARIFDANLLARSEGVGDPSRVPIFVVGMPRSGSTLIEQILASHPLVHGAGEVDHLNRLLHPPISFPDGIPSLDERALSYLGSAWAAALTPVGERKTRSVDKLPGNFGRIGLIRMILPNARIIHTVRNPLDTCISCYSKLFSQGQNFSYDLGELGRYYRRYRQLMAHWRSLLPADAILDVAYEDVVDDLEGQARRLLDYCGLSWDDRCLRFHENARPVQTASAYQVRQPVFRGSVQRWRRYAAQLTPLLEELRDIV